MSVTSLTSNNEATILSRTIDADNGDWSVEVARGMLSLSLSPADVSRMNELATKASDGVLTPDEEIEIESYRQVGALLELVKAKAHESLRRSSQEPAQ